ncbi:MAG: BACON domain-containing protein [Bacteroidaceae bacterium]|nr:BACON domain-containing protein [Bacteroidaceae bacterium]
MKKHYFLMLFVAVCSAIGFVSCGPDDPDPFMTVGVTQIEIPAEGVSKTFSVSSDCDWSISGMSSWLTVTPASGNGENVTVTVTAGKNETTTDRICTLIISSKAGTKTIAVTQKAAAGVLGISPASLSFDKEAGSKTLTINANVDWSVSSNASWLHVNPQAGNSSTKNITVTVDKNETTESRSGDLLFSSSVGSQTVKVTQGAASGEIKVNGASSTELMFGSNANGNEPAQTVNITSNTSWTISDVPDWVRVSPTSGSGNVNVSLTVTNENWSDEVRSAIITVKTTSGSSASVVVKQNPLFDPDLHVSLSNIVTMWDGFACDLKFGSKAKGYKEAFFLESDIDLLTEKDIYNKLMECKEWGGINSYTSNAFDQNNDHNKVVAGTTIVYCVASFGNDNNTDGTHKYGAMTMQRIKTKTQTPSSDMLVSMTNTSQNWTFTFSKQGSIGQECNDFYWFFTTGDDAESCAAIVHLNTCAWLVYRYLKPWIEAGELVKFSGPQQYPATRTSGENKCFVTTWGINKNTNAYSAELRYNYKDLSSDLNIMYGNNSMLNYWKNIDPQEKRERMEEIMKSVVFCKKSFR